MFPLIKEGDKIHKIIKNPTYHENDIVVFLQGNKLIAHRIIYTFLSGQYITKGDNNTHADPPINYDQILGLATHINSHNSTYPIESLYQSQSLTYLTELTNFSKLTKSRRVSFLVLKGLPIYLYYQDSLPKRYVLDIDILIKPKDYKIFDDIFKSLGYSKAASSTHSTQFSYIKQTALAPVIFDLHLEPAIAFTKLPQLNKLLPQTKSLTTKLWQNSRQTKISNLSLRLLTPNFQFIYLLLHLFHHNLRGMHRYQLLVSVVPKINVETVSRNLVELQLTNLAHPGIRLLNKLYPQTKKVVKEISNKLHPSPASRIIGAYLKPWHDLPTVLARAQLLTWTLVTSPLSPLSILPILLHPDNYQELSTITTPRSVSKSKKPPKSLSA